MNRIRAFRDKVAIQKPTTRTVLVIVMIVAILAIGILAAFIGSRIGKNSEENQAGVDCSKCYPSKLEKGWKGFSITVIALGIPLLVVFFLFFGCVKMTLKECQSFVDGASSLD